MKKFFVLIYVVLSLSAFAWGDYDKYGWHKKTGVNKETGILYDVQGYDKDGYDEQGYNRSGYDIFGYNKKGFNERGIHNKGYKEYIKQGFSSLAFNYDEEGYDVNGFNSFGYDRGGYNKNGYDQNGYNKSGYNIAGYNIKGYDKEGYNKSGWSEIGINKQTQTKYNSLGYDKNGFDKLGINNMTKEKYDKYGLDVNRKPANYLSTIKSSDLNEIEKNIVELLEMKEPKKGEFETSRDYEIRKKESLEQFNFKLDMMKQQSYILNLNKSGYNADKILKDKDYVKVESTLQYKYDADKLQWNFFIPRSIFVDYTTFNGNYSYDAVTNREILSTGSYPIRFEVPMEIEQAKKTELEIQVLYSLSTINKDTIKNNKEVIKSSANVSELTRYTKTVNISFDGVLVWDKGKKNLLYSIIF